MAMTNGGPAFPLRMGTDEFAYNEGMTLRDWFAGQALAGQLACSVASGTDYEYAEFAYQLADAMLKAREAQHD